MTAVVPPGGLSAVDLPADPAAAGTILCVAVPQAAVQAVAGWLLPTLAPDAVVLDVSSSKVGPLSSLRQARPDLAVVGVHPLFSPSARSAAGQTFVVCPSPSAPTAHHFVVDLLREVGGLPLEMTAEKHDLLMSYIQTAAHQASLLFADVVTNSGFEPDELWEFRTPLFEGLLGLSTRVLAPAQEQTISSIQVMNSGTRVAEEFADALVRLREALRRGDLTSVQQYMAALREPFSGTRFAQMQQSAASAVDAMQNTRTQLAEAAADGRLVGLGSTDSAEVHVGRVLRLSPTSVDLEDLLIGPRNGAGALIHEDWSRRNARKLGLQGKARCLTLSIGRTRVMTAEELHRVLDQRLARITFDVRLLVPESVAGQAAAILVADDAEVESATVVREQPHRGRREVILRVRTRCDVEVDRLARTLRQRAERALVPPRGAVRPLTSTLANVGFVAGADPTSDEAVARLRDLWGPQAAEAAATGYQSVVEVLAAVSAGSCDVAVLRLLDSEAGLDDEAVAALLDAACDVEAAGVVDVVAPSGAVARFLVVTEPHRVPSATDDHDARNLWLVPAEALAAELSALTTQAGYSELVVGSGGMALVVSAGFGSTEGGGDSPVTGRRFVGVPWSPRTPLTGTG
jgi:prephenate dehydrogenase/ferredoxin-fold anticodon binding domain-containing protein